METIDLETASSEQIVAKAKCILEFAQTNKVLPSGTMLELVEWLTAFVIRLGNDIKGKPLKTEDEVQKEIEEWAKGVERFLT